MYSTSRTHWPNTRSDVARPVFNDAGHIIGLYLACQSYAIAYTLRRTAIWAPTRDSSRMSSLASMLYCFSLPGSVAAIVHCSEFIILFDRWSIHEIFHVASYLSVKGPTQLCLAYKWY